MGQNREVEPTNLATSVSETTPPTDAKPASPPTDPATEKLRESVEAALGPALGTEEARAEVVERVVQLVTEEFFRGPLPHPRHLQAYEKTCPGLADRIVAMAEKAHSKREDRLDRAMLFEYNDRRLGLFLGFFALLALLTSGTFIVWLGNVAVGGSLLGAAVLGTAIGTFVHGRRSEEEADSATVSDKANSSPEKPGLLQRISSVFSPR